jgi:hypothetical protein
MEPDEAPDAIARRQEPRVLASFSNGTPFLVQRRIGRGEVFFVSTGVLSGWNNLTRTNAVVFFDRLLRGMLGRTFPRRNYSTQEQVIVAIDPADRSADFSLERPASESESLFVDAVGSDRFAITLKNLTQRGHYRLVAERPLDATAIEKRDATPLADHFRTRGRAINRLWQRELAVNGPTEESDLQTVSEADLRERLAGAAAAWVGRGEPIRLEGAAVRGQEFWKWLMAAALACLLLELAILSKSHAATRTACDKNQTERETADYADTRG